MPHATHLPTEEPAGIQPASLLVRVATAAIYAAVVVGSVIAGGLATGIVFGIMAGFAAAEFYALERRQSRLPNALAGVTASAAMPVVAALWGLPGLSGVVTALLAAALVWHTAFRRTRTADAAITVFGALYTGFLLAYLVLILDTFAAGLPLALTLIVSVWVNDVFAYLVGSLVGRHKLAPSISPKKSWEGLIAGTLGTVGTWLAGAMLGLVGIELGVALAVGSAVSLAAVVGDLAESRMKREAQVKDSGRSLPGHGGFLDRLDSLIFVCLVAYWVLWWAGVR